MKNENKKKWLPRTERKINVYEILAMKNENKKAIKIFSFMDLSIQYLVRKYLKRYKYVLRLNTKDDLIQEINISILKALKTLNLKKIKCDPKTYLLGVANRKIRMLISSEFALKRKAHFTSLNLEKYCEKNNKKLVDLDYENFLKERKFNGEIKQILKGLSVKDRKVFFAMMIKQSIRKSAKSLGIDRQCISTILNNKIKPLLKQYYISINKIIK